jgi:hypothetical protein
MTKCNWCFGTKNVLHMYIPQTPVLEWMEDKLILLDGEFYEQDLTETEEWEIQVYDTMVRAITRGTVCTKCWKKDQKLYEMYYGPDGEDDYLRLI